MSNEDIRAAQLAYGKEQAADRARRDAFRSPLWHAMKGAAINPRRFNDTTQFNKDETE